MKTLRILLAIGWIGVGAASTRGEEAAGCPWADYALPIMGTDNVMQLSTGNLYPAICRPWGMNFWSPQTGPMGSGWFYNYADRKIRGIRQTHQPSPWIGDYGQFAVLPITGRTVFKEDERASWFSHKAEEAHPYSYRVYLAEHDTVVEIAPTERAAAMRVTYPETDRAQFVVDAFDAGSYVRVDRAKRRVYGWSTKMNGRPADPNGKVPMFRTWFVVEFDHPIEEAQVWADGAFVANVQERQANHVGAVVRFARMKRGDRVNVRMASSFIDFDQAERNLGELDGDDYETVAAKGRAAWNAALGRVRVEGATEEQCRTFYTCLYRALLFPRRLFEFGADGQPIHRSPTTEEVRPGVYFCDTGFWDTFRSLFPLLNFLYPEMNAQMTKGLEACYDESGWLPEWSSPGHRDCMVGNNSASVVADAWLTGVAKGCDVNKLYAALLHGANNSHPSLSSVGRRGAKEYNEKGYVPRDVGINESAARTLEYAYDDWCIARLGAAIGRPQEEVALYVKRSQNWRNLFNAKVGLMSGRNQDGSFDAHFNPFKWGGDFTEGNALHYTWSVFHDVAGLMQAMGGKDAFNGRLDEIFKLPPVYDESYYKFVIHEIREMQIMNFGQYAHGNQPIQHGIYLYDWSGEPWKTQYWVREVCNRLYKPTPDGYCGDEDNGQTSAWFVWSSLGFYPVCPGSGEYALGAPRFPKAVLTMPGGRELVISAPDVSDAKRYVRTLTRNGAAYGKNFVRLDDLRTGGRLDFEMADQPNKSRGTDPADAPYSWSRDH